MDVKQRLLHKFSKRQCSPQELRELFNYLKEDPSSEYEEVMDEVWHELQTHASLEPLVSEAMYEEVQRRIQSANTQVPRILPINYWRATAKIAAAFAGIVLSAWVLYLLVLNPHEKYETAFGVTTTIELPDHSVVVLNGNSRIHYLKEWDNNNIREVWLEGEAFFSVVHTADHQKFVVHTNNMEIKVLGTEFNVNNRRGETKVTLSSGLVSINGKGRAARVKDVLMHPGQQASLNALQQFHLRKVDTRQFTTWKDNVMIFDRTAVRELAVMIEETYGLEVVLEGDSIHDVELSGSMPANDIDALLGMLRETLELDVVRSDDKVIIRKK